MQPVEYHKESALINGIGTFFFAIAIGWLVAAVGSRGQPVPAGIATIYFVCAMFFWLAQMGYHLFLHAGRQSLIFRNTDRGSVLFLIASIFTPLVTTGGNGVEGAIVPLVLLWCCAGGGMILLLAWKEIPRKITPVLSLVMLIIGIIATIAIQLPEGTFTAGWSVAFFVGIALTIAGGVIYAIQRPNLKPGRFGFHELYHALVLASTLLLHLSILAVL